MFNWVLKTSLVLPFCKIRKMETLHWNRQISKVLVTGIVKNHWLSFFESFFVGSCLTEKWERTLLCTSNSLGNKITYDVLQKFILKVLILLVMLIKRRWHWSSYYSSADWFLIYDVFIIFKCFSEKTVSNGTKSMSSFGSNREALITPVPPKINQK